MALILAHRTILTPPPGVNTVVPHLCGCAEILTKMNLQIVLPLVTFEYEEQVKVRTITIDGEPWFYAMDLCKALEIKNGRDAVSRLDKDDVGTTDAIDSMGRKQKYSIVNEPGMYQLVFQSRTEAAAKFKRWVTKEVLPQIRKTGGFGFVAPTHVFVRRFNDNWDRVDQGYFSVISELYIRVFGRFEQVGHVLAEKGPDGKELRPDVSVGKTFAAWLRENHPELEDLYKKYKHLVGGVEVDARQYKNAVWPLFTEFVDTVWMVKYAPDYLESRDPAALQLLPKLLPPADIKAQSEHDVGKSKLELLKQAVLKAKDNMKATQQTLP